MKTWSILGYDQLDFPSDPYLVADGFVSFEDAENFLENCREGEQTYEIVVEELE